MTQHVDPDLVVNALSNQLAVITGDLHALRAELRRRGLACDECTRLLVIGYGAPTTCGDCERP